MIASITLDIGLDRWFEIRTKTIINSSLSIAEAYVREDVPVGAHGGEDGVHGSVADARRTAAVWAETLWAGLPLLTTEDAVA